MFMIMGELNEDSRAVFAAPCGQFGNKEMKLYGVMRECLRWLYEKENKFEG
jgi:hypothetical protein